MRKMNGKLFLLLVVGLITTAGSVFGIHAYQYERIGKALLWQARRAEEMDQPVRAARYLQRYLEFQPRDNQEKGNLARLLAGPSYPAGSKARRSAQGLLDTLLRQEDRPELRGLLVKIALEHQDYQLARDHLQKLLPLESLFKKSDQGISAPALSGSAGAPGGSDEGKGELIGYWGQILESEKRKSEAIDCYRVAIKISPRDRDQYERLANLLRRQNETDPAKRKANLNEADDVMDRLVSQLSEDYQAHLSRWRYRRDFSLIQIGETANQGHVQLEEAGKDILSALSRKPDSVEVLLAAADLERIRARVVADDAGKSVQKRQKEIQNHRQVALDYLRKAEELVKPEPTTFGEHKLFQILWHKGNLLLDEMDLQYVFADANAAAGQDENPAIEQVRQIISRVRKLQMGSAADYMEGRWLIHEGKWGEAASKFERARAQLSGQRDLACQVDLYLGMCYERLQEPAQMFNSYKRVLEFDAESVPALLGMASARWAQGQLDNALVQYQLVMKQNKVPARAWTDIARLELERQVQNPAPDWKQLDAILKAARESFPDGNLDLHLIEADSLVRQGKNSDAATLLANGQKKNPTEVEYIASRVGIALLEKNNSLAKSLMDQAKREYKDCVSLRLATARSHLAFSPNNSADLILGLADRRDGFSEENQAKLLAGLADILLRAGHRPAARKLWKQMVELPDQKNDLRLHLLLFDLAMKDDDENGMKKCLSDIREIEQVTGSYFRYGNALYLMWQARRMETGPERSKQLAAARQHLEAVQRQRPSWASVYLARAELSELLGKPDQAIKDYQESLKNGETSPTVTRRLVSLLAQQGRDSEAQFLLARLHQNFLQGNELGKVAVAMAIRRGETGQAVEMMRQAVREDSTSSQDQLWMARVLASAGPSYAGDAEKRLKAALELNPKDPESYLAISQLLISQKRRDEALNWMEKAKQNLPPEQLPLVLAAVHENLGELSKAMAYYSEAIQKNPDDLKTIRVVVNAHLLGNRVREAEPLLRKMVEGKVAVATPADREWARRGLAQILGSSPNFARYVEALQLLGVKVDAEGRLPRELPAPENSDDRRALARILAQGNQKVYRQNAIRLFEEMFREKSLTSEDEFTLSMLYEAEGDIRKAQDKLRNLVQPQVRTPQYLAQYAMSLILQQRQPDALDEAEKIIGWIEELERQRQSGPNSFASVELRARLLEARGKGDEAIKLLQAHITRKGASPEEILLVLASQTRLKRYADAFLVCESAWKEGKCRPDALASVSVSLLRVMSPSESQTAFVEERLKQALSKSETSQQIQLQLADLYDFMGQYEKAADSYRQVLKKEPENIFALNNLAWLQAYQAGQVNQALEMINRAVQGAGRRADLLDTRAMVHLALKDTASALSDLKEANKEGDSPTRLFHLARVLHEDRDTSKAREILRQAKAKGFQLTQLHPVEQPEAQRLLKQYGIR